MSLCCTVGYKSVTVMYYYGMNKEHPLRMVLIKFEFNDI